MTRTGSEERPEPAAPLREDSATTIKQVWSGKRSLAWLAVAVAGWFAFYALTVVLPGNPEQTPTWVQVLSLLLGILAVSGVLLAGERATWPVWSRWVMFICGAALIFTAYALNLRSIEMRPWLVLAVLVIALPVGYWIGDRMEKATYLIPVAITMSFADIFSVYQGPTKRVVEDLAQHEQNIEAAVHELGPAATPEQITHVAAQVNAPFVDYIVVHLPVAGTQGTVPLLGIGDFVILAFLFRAAWIHNISPVKVFTASIVSLIIALAVSQIASMPLPALPFIGLGTVGYLALTESRFRRLDRIEIAASIIVPVLFILLIFGRWLTVTLGM